MADQGADPGSGAPDGGSPEGGLDKTPKGDDVVPKSQFLAALKNAEEKRERELAAVRTEFETKLAEATKPKAEAPKEYTRAELTAMVEAGTISQTQADAQIDFQISAKAEAKAAQVATSIVNDGQRKGYVDSEIARYTALIPEILEGGSKERDKVKKEFDFLRRMGDPPGPATELKAIRAAYGPVESLEQARKGRNSHESHQEHGAGGGGDNRPGNDGKPKMTARQRDYYEGLVGPGKLYPDWKAVEDELKHAKPSYRQRASA